MAFVKAADLAEVPPGRVKVVEIGDKEVALCNVGGEIFAIANVCTHDNGPLGEGYLMGGAIECPRHGARFDVKTGDVMTLPAVMPIPLFRVRVEGGAIMVEID